MDSQNLLVREVSVRLLLLALLEDQGQINTPHLCVQQRKKKKMDSRWKYLGVNKEEREDLRRCWKEQIHEYNKGDADLHCISVRCS